MILNSPTVIQGLLSVEQCSAIDQVFRDSPQGKESTDKQYAVDPDLGVDVKTLLETCSGISFQSVHLCILREYGEGASIQDHIDGVGYDDISVSLIISSDADPKDWPLVIEDTPDSGAFTGYTAGAGDAILYSVATKHRRNQMPPGMTRFLVAIFHCIPTTLSRAELDSDELILDPVIDTAAVDLLLDR